MFTHYTCLPSRLCHGADYNTLPLELPLLFGHSGLVQSMEAKITFLFTVLQLNL